MVDYDELKIKFQTLYPLCAEDIINMANYLNVEIPDEIKRNEDFGIMITRSLVPRYSAYGVDDEDGDKKSLCESFVELADKLRTQLVNLNVKQNV